MKVFTENRADRMDVRSGGTSSMPHEHDLRRPLPPHEHHGHRPLLPHERRTLMNVEFGEEDLVLLETIFGDPDTAQAAAHIIQEVAPPEIQILAVQLMKINGSNTVLSANDGINSPVKFPSPTMDETAQNLYTELYGDAGARFVGILNSSPNEIAVISRLIAYTDEKTKEVP